MAAWAASAVGEGIPPAAGTTTSRSFAEVIGEKSVAPLAAATDGGARVQTVTATHRGEPAVRFAIDDIERVAIPFCFALVGKFSRGRPIMEEIQKFFRALDLKEEVSLGLLDRRHILIRLTNDADYYRIWSRSVWCVLDAPMRVFKWSVDFHVDRESSVVLVWFVLPKLPIHLFHKDCLFPIVACLGRPLRVDAATAAGSRPSVARYALRSICRRHCLVGYGLRSEIRWVSGSTWCQKISLNIVGFVCTRGTVRMNVVLKIQL
mgnify:CR=1 FL=1